MTSDLNLKISYATFEDIQEMVALSYEKRPYLV